MRIAFCRGVPSGLPSGLILLLSPIFLCHRIKDGGFIVAIRLSSFRPPKIRLHCRLFIVDVVTFLYGAAFLRYTTGGGDRGIFCLIEHFFYIRQHKEHFLQSLSRTEEKSPPAPVRKDKQRFQTWPARKLSISTLALLKERKFTFYQKGRFH